MRKAKASLRFQSRMSLTIPTLPFVIEIMDRIARGAAKVSDREPTTLFRHGSPSIVPLNSIDSGLILADFGM